MNAPLRNLGEGRLVSHEAEQFVIGALLQNNDAVDRMGDLREEHFWVAEHREIFRQVLKMVLQNKPADVLTVSDALKCAGSKSGDLVYLNALAQNTPSSANIGRYAAIVRERAIRRGLGSIGREMVELVESSVLDSGDLVDQVSSKLEQLAQAKTKQEPVLASDDLAAHITQLDERYNGSGVKAISTGYTEIDAKLNGGLRPGQVIVMAGRPKMGKTALALNMGTRIAENHGVLVCSMEMQRGELHDRNIAVLGRIPLPHLLDPTKMTDEDWPRLTMAVQKITALNLFLDDQGALTLMDVRMKAKQVKRRSGLKVLVLDYLQLMEGDGANRNAEIESISRGLKALAKELDIAIILLSQLNRDLEKRPSKRPLPSDLRDSGSIEQDADVVMLLYRDEVYNPDSMDKGICEVDIALNRQGSPGRVALAYVNEQTRFENLERQWSPAPAKQISRSRRFDDE